MFKISEGEAEHIMGNYASANPNKLCYLSLNLLHSVTSCSPLHKQASYNAQFTSFTSSVLLAVKAIFSVNQLTL